MAMISCRLFRPIFTGLAIALSVALVTAIVCGLTWANIASDRFLPWISVNHVQGNLHLLLPIIPQ